MERAVALDWFSVEPLDKTTFAITEEGHWEHVHCYLFVGSDRAALVDSASPTPTTTTPQANGDFWCETVTRASHFGVRPDGVTRACRLWDGCVARPWDNDDAPKPTVTFGAKQSLVRHTLGSDPRV
jgi:hypothetical protein